MGYCRTYRYLLQPTSRQMASLDRLLRNQAELYNAALEERRGTWKWNHESVSYYAQCKTLTGLAEVRPEMVHYGVTVCRGTLKRLDRAFDGFYRRCRAGQSPGYPRFKSAMRFSSVQWEDKAGWKLDEQNARLRLMGVGHVKVRLHRPLGGTPKTITVAREGNRWFVSVRCVDVPPKPLEPTGCEVGIDFGVCALVATSDGRLVKEGRFAKRSEEKLAEAQMALSRKKRGSNRRRRAAERLGALHRQVANQRRDLAHKVSRQIVNDYDFIVVEDLKIKNLAGRPKPRPNAQGGFDPNGAAAKSGLNRSIHDAGWGVVLAMLAYKAEEAGREFMAVDPRRTSQRCAQCDHVAPENRLTQAKFRCTRCRHADHADVNAAMNILRAGRALRT